MKADLMTFDVTVVKTHRASPPDIMLSALTEMFRRHGYTVRASGSETTGMIEVDTAGRIIA